MYSAEQRMKAVETFARFGCSAADTIAELGYPTRHTLRNWWREYQISGDGFPERKRREPKYSDEEKRGASAWARVSSKRSFTPSSSRFKLGNDSVSETARLISAAMRASKAEAT